MIHRIHVEVTEEDGELASRGDSHNCMVHRAIMRAVPGLFAPGQLEVTGWEGLDWYIHVSPYESVLKTKWGLNHPNLYEPEKQNAKLREELSEAPLWNRAVNPGGTLIRFGNQKGRATGLGREDINRALEFWDAGYTVPAFSFDFEVETRDDWDYHQMDLFDWYNYEGVDTGRELIAMIDEALLAKRLGCLEEVPEPVLVAP